MISMLLGIAIGGSALQANVSAQQEYDAYLARMDKLTSAVCGLRNPGGIGMPPSVTVCRMKAGGRYAMVGTYVEWYSDGHSGFDYSPLTNVYLKSAARDMTQMAAIFGRGLFPSKKPLPPITKAHDATFRLSPARAYRYEFPGSSGFELFVDPKTHLPIGYRTYTDQVVGAETEIIGFLPDPGVSDAAVTWEPPPSAKETSRPDDLFPPGTRR